MTFKQFHKDHPLLLQSQARKFWKGSKSAAIELLETEYQRVIGGKKVTVRNCIKLLKTKLQC